MRRIKIVATIGPQTDSPEAVRALVEAGMDVARLNGAHATREWHAKMVKVLRQEAPHVPILFDIPGRKIRTGILEHEPTFKAGETLVLTTDPSYKGREKVPVTYPKLHEDLAAQTTILADDGQVRLTVLEVDGRDIICRAETAGVLRSAKGINVPSVALRSAVLNERDLGILEFSKTQGVDFIGVSFVESDEHVGTVRELLGSRGPRIVAKIETRKGLQAVAAIAQVADALMVDRGDLSVETALEQVAVFQKEILRVARSAKCPVIVATEMLHSMIAHPVPTKAEVSDITNAILDGAAALMLSGETAIGAFPVESVGLMRRVADVAWEHVQALEAERGGPDLENIPQAMGEAIALLCRRLPITKIIAVTISGFAARMVAAYRPRQPIFAVSNDPASVRSFNLLPGTQGVYVDIPFSRTSTNHIPKCLEALWRSGRLGDEEMILVTAVGYPKPQNRMNLVETHVVADLRESLGWRR